MTTVTNYPELTKKSISMKKIDHEWILATAQANDITYSKVIQELVRYARESEEAANQLIEETDV